MTQSVAAALQQATLYSDDLPYRLVNLPANAAIAAASIASQIREPFLAVVIDKDEVTLILPDEDYEDVKGRLLDHTVTETRYRLITFDVELEPSLVGFMAQISQTLAEAGISMIPIGAYSRDHLFVSERDFDQAMQVLRELQAKQD